MYGIEYLNGEILRKFENLKLFYVIDDVLLEVSPIAFDICPKLEVFLMYSSQLTTFPSGMFKNCENLKHLEFSNKKLNLVPENLFGSTKNLELLTLDGNLTFLPEKLLQNMKNLTFLDIGVNRLTELSPNFLANAHNLEEFHAFSNEFEDQRGITDALNGRMNLKVLSIYNNNFTNFDFQFFSQFKKLEFLWIGMFFESHLTNISWQSLPSSLKTLFVDGIDENVPENAFNHLDGLEKLSLSGYGINSLDKNTFKSLNHLSGLSIGISSIKSLPPEIFVNQVNLTYLSISNTKIHRLNSNSFGIHPHLQRINFSFNKINEIQRGIFSKFHSYLMSVNFESNVCINDIVH